ncbi:MAG: UDP-N-acetylmuramate dehydrogenase [Candidatus Moranbacteria bacterium]|nr:UDP-N-acetylmuramate dehydrogenase [Candidatus Moranbacteria bacterium]
MYKIEKNKKASRLTTFKIGGRIKYFVEVTNLDDLETVFFEIKKSKLPFRIIGGGSNILFSSAGFQGWIVKMNASSIDENGTMIDVEAGALLTELVNFSVDRGLSGIHKLSGIPGTVGGAIRGNAGAFGVSVSDKLREVLVLNVSSLKFESFKKKKSKFGYRDSIFKSRKELVIAGARFELDVVDKKTLKKERDEILASRKDKAYYKHPSAGSIFKNIDLSEIIKSANLQQRKEIRDLIEEFYKDNNLAEQGKKIKEVKTIPAGYLIDKVGLKGKRVGDARISKDHGNVIYNLFNAESSEVLELIQMAKTRVKNEFGITLEEEIEFIA